MSKPHKTFHEWQKGREIVLQHLGFHEDLESRHKLFQIFIDVFFGFFVGFLIIQHHQIKEASVLWLQCRTISTKYSSPSH